MPADGTRVFCALQVDFHCWMCGKNCNSEKQWQGHISSEKHKEKVFHTEDDQYCWQHRFPTGYFSICDRYVDFPHEDCWFCTTSTVIVSLDNIWVLSLLILEAYIWTQSSSCSLNVSSLFHGYMKRFTDMKCLEITEQRCVFVQVCPVFAFPATIV